MLYSEAQMKDFWEASGEIKCVYPNGFAITKRDMDEVKSFGKIVKNYLKIKRIDNQSNKKKP